MKLISITIFGKVQSIAFYWSFYYTCFKIFIHSYIRIKTRVIRENIYISFFFCEKFILKHQYIETLFIYIINFISVDLLYKCFQFLFIYESKVEILLIFSFCTHLSTSYIF